MALTKASAGVINTEQLVGFRNRIHNGDFRINQRDVWSRSNTLTNISYAGVTDKAFAADRWWTYVYNGATNGLNSSNATIAIVNDHPLNASGNCYSLTVNSNATTNANIVVSSTTTDFCVLQHTIEAYDIADLYNSSSTTPTTLSFWVKSNKTGKYSVEIRPNASPDTSKIILLPYTITQSGVWEKKVLTIPVYTLGNIPLSNAQGLQIQFGMASNLKGNHTDGSYTITQSKIDACTNQWGDNPWGSGVVVSDHVNLFENTGNYWRITDVQLEAGSVASAFDRRPQGYELRLCQRYLHVWSSEGQSYRWLGTGFTTTNEAQVSYKFPVIMRTSPSVSFSEQNKWIVDKASGAYTSTVIEGTWLTKEQCRIRVAVASGVDANHPTAIGNNGDSGTRYAYFSAEI